MLSKTAVILSLVAPVTVIARTLDVFNNCGETIYPAAANTGWEAAAGSSNTIDIGDSWNGRVWARRECDSGDLSATCAVGSPPASLAEFNIVTAPGTDFYDLSLVDGFDLPLAITSDQNCPTATCSTDINPTCPAELQVTDSAGTVVGCRTACNANLDGNPGDSANCCSGSHDTPETCPSSGVQYYSVFKDACPQAYAYAYDDATSTFTCDAALAANYIITFCP